MMKAELKARGRLHIVIRDQSGRIIEEAVTTNLVVNSGLGHISNQMAGQSEAAMSHMAVGLGTTPPAATDTALSSELDRNALTSKMQGSGGGANKVTYVADWAAGDATGALTEAGIFNSASAGQMLARATFPVKNKGANDTMTLTWELTIQ